MYIYQRNEENALIDVPAYQANVDDIADDTSFPALPFSGRLPSSPLKPVAKYESIKSDIQIQSYKKHTSMTVITNKNWKGLFIGSHGKNLQEYKDRFHTEISMAKSPTSCKVILTGGRSDDREVRQVSCQVPCRGD